MGGPESFQKGRATLFGTFRPPQGGESVEFHPRTGDRKRVLAGHRRQTCMRPGDEIVETVGLHPTVFGRTGEQPQPLRLGQKRALFESGWMRLRTEGTIRLLGERRAGHGAQQHHQQADTTDPVSMALGIPLRSGRLLPAFAHGGPLLLPSACPPGARFARSAKKEKGENATPAS